MGQTLPRFWHPCKKGGRGKFFLILRLFFAEPIFARGMTPKIDSFFALFFFFCRQQHLVPGINYFRKSLGFVQYSLYNPEALDNPLWTSTMPNNSFSADATVPNVLTTLCTPLQRTQAPTTVSGA